MPAIAVLPVHVVILVAKCPSSVWPSDPMAPASLIPLLLLGSLRIFLTPAIVVLPLLVAICVTKHPSVWLLNPMAPASLIPLLLLSSFLGIVPTPVIALLPVLVA